MLTVPVAALRLLGQTNTGEVEPFKRAELIVASYHITIRHVVAEAKSWLVTLILASTLRLCLKHHLRASLAFQGHAARLCSPVIRLRYRSERPQ